MKTHAGNTSTAHSDLQAGTHASPVGMHGGPASETSFQRMANSSPRATSLQRQAEIMAGGPRTMAAARFQQLANDATETAQRKRWTDATPVTRTSAVPGEASVQAKPEPNDTGLPDGLRAGIEALSGMSMGRVKVHYNSARPAQFRAHAYALGNEIHVASGQEKHLPHEAWHVVQQAQGRVRPTRQLKSGVAVNDDAGLETEADAMGAKALQLGGPAIATRLDMGRHDRGCYCVGCCAPARSGGTTYSLKSYGPSSGVFQLATTISISDANGDTATGTSGNQAEVDTRLGRWPAIKRLFVQHVQPQHMPVMNDGVAGNETYARNWNFCAEPHALANLLHRHDGVNDHTVTHAWLTGLHFPAKAVDENGASLWPCPVCAQWVTSGNLPMALHTVVPAGPIENAAQIAARTREEEAKTNFADNVTSLGNQEEVAFDASHDTRDTLRMYLQYLDELRRNKGGHKDIAAGNVKAVHAEAWAGIVHANSAPDFVAEAERLCSVMQANCKWRKEDRIKGSQLTDADNKAIESMDEYYKLCETKLQRDGAGALITPNRTLIVDRLARADASMVDGEIRNLNRRTATQVMPDMFADSDPADLFFTIDADGTLSIVDTATGAEWPKDD